MALLRGNSPRKATYDTTKGRVVVTLRIEDALPRDLQTALKEAITQLRKA